MRVVLVVPTISRNGGGVSEVARNVSYGLASVADIDLRVESIKDEYYDQDLRNWSGIRVVAHRHLGPKLYGFSPGLLISLFRSQPDIVHVHALWMFHCAAVLIWSLVTGGKYIVTPHGMLEPWILKRSPFLKWLVSALYQNYFLRRASGLQVLTAKEAQDVNALFKDCPMRVIPNFVNPVIMPDAIAMPLWWDDQMRDRDIYLYLGRVHEKKGCRELCEAWEILCSEDHLFRQNSFLVICGWVDGISDFAEKIEQLRLRWGNAVFGGPQYGHAKDATLSMSTFVILPSKSEGLPMVVLEAWSHSKSVLMTTECNLRVAFEVEAAIEIKPNVASIVIGLAACSRMPFSERRLIGSRAKELVDTQFSQAVVIDSLLSLYRDAIS